MYRITVHRDIMAMTSGKYLYNKRSVLRRQSRDTNRNIKRSVYCQYGDSIVQRFEHWLFSREFLSDEARPTLETLDFTIRIGSTPTFLYFNNDIYIYFRT